MPPEDQHLDELLSAYLDGRLEGDDARRMQTRLESDGELRQRLEDLREQRQALSQLFGAATDRYQSDPRSEELFRRVMAEVRLRSPVDRSPAEAPTVRPDRRIATGWGRKDGRRLALMVAGGAAVLLLVGTLWMLPQLTPAPMAGRQDGPADTVAPDNGNHQAIGGAETGGGGTGFDVASAAPPSGAETVGTPSQQQPATDASADRPQYVSQLDFSQSFVFVVDVEISAEGLRNDVFHELLRGAGIQVEPPIAANEEVARALSETRMIVQPGGEAGAAASQAWIYFVRADINQIGPVLDKIYFDRQHFPRVAFDLAIDNPSTRLMQTIASATGQRFAANRPFAAPVAIGSDTQQPAPLPNVKKPERFVSAVRRQRGFSQDGLAAALPPGDLSNVLFIVRPAP